MINIGNFNIYPNDIDYVGIKSETESFIHNIKKYIYLFKKCSVR